MDEGVRGGGRGETKKMIHTCEDMGMCVGGGRVCVCTG